VPTPREPTAEALARIYRGLAASRSLAPGPGTNALFAELVGLATTPLAAHTERDVLADPRVSAIAPALRALCARGETELERAWAEHIGASRHPRRELRRFPYLPNYERLTRMEHHALAGLGAGPPRRVLFAGAGPLPLTALLLTGRHGWRGIDCIDIDEAATRSAQRLVEALHLTGLRFACADLLATTELAGYDLVYLAAMLTQRDGDAPVILAHLAEQMAPGTVLLTRSARGLRSLLYQPIGIDELGALRPLTVLHPYTDVINSVVLAEKPPGARPPR
jgi:nicotianamine synthase